MAEILAAGERDRPSRHGAIVGEALTKMAEAGCAGVTNMPEMCATCAFRPDCMVNQMGGTTLAALKCAIGVDTDRFACHHGMKDGWPTKICAGYVAAKLAPWEVTKELVLELNERLQSLTGPDEIRAAFDAWIAEIDPDNRMDDYQRARAWAKRPAPPPHTEETR